MVMGHSLEDEMKRIDDFFSNLSVNEFDKMAIEAGMGEIKSSCESSYVKASQLPLEATYSNKTIYNNDWETKWVNHQDNLQGAA